MTRVGGYLLIAVIAFMTGVLITVILKWNLEKKKRPEREKQEEHEEVGYLEDDILLQAAGGKTGIKRNYRTIPELINNSDGMLNMENCPMNRS